ncbi:hypothetical protein LCGC14_0595940 [marine sediment metagenome]|uniref:Uncharacterized protein n=1 Tax=marine sediment metagenome TaxID=412755 RepID=A0A0F9RC11_9ZZZZ|nr:hypothetical protein [bacterium]
MLVKSSEIDKIINKAKYKALFPGGIYSIFSEKSQYGMGKSQFAHFLLEEYEKKSTEKLSAYHTLSPSSTGLKELEDELRSCFTKCNNITGFYYFIDEIDLISDPEYKEEEKVKLIEKFGNIIIKTSDEAYNKDIPFYIFLVLSNRILEDFNKFAPHRIKRRITPFLRVDIVFDEKDIEMFATNFFALLWVSNHKDIQKKLEKYDFRFKELMGNMISIFVNHLDYLGLNVKSVVIGDLVEKFRNMFEIIFDDINDEILEKINLGKTQEVGKNIERILKNYLLSKNRPLVINENENEIIITYKIKEKFINGHKSDGYYDFRIGDNQIGIMPVEITTQKDLKNRKGRQIKKFAENHVTLLIWAYLDRNIMERELSKIDEKVANELQRILIPRDLIQYTLILEERAFSLLEEFRRNIIENIETYLRKYAKILFNRWMMEKPFIPISTGVKQGDKIHEVSLSDLKDRVVRLLENVFQYLEGVKRRQHKGMKAAMKKELNSLNKPLQDVGIALPLFNLDTVYREIAQELLDENLCQYAKLEDTSYLSKKDGFSVKLAVEKCKKVIISRIEDKFNKTK